MANNSNPNATSVQVFNNEQFGEIRTVEVDGKIYFVGNDVAKALGYSDPKGAVSRHCKGASFQRLPDNQGVMQDTKVIPEGDIYRLAARSELPGAEEFESWIFDEILPTIRKTGGYMLARKDVTFSATIKFIESMCKNVRMSDDAKLSMYRDVAELYGISAEILPSCASECDADRSINAKERRAAV